MLYENGRIKSYYFTSFENVELFWIDYDSSEGKEMTAINNNAYYFFHTKDGLGMTTTDREYEVKEGFIYLINPPTFNFQYDLCVINPQDSILRIEKKFDMAKTWDAFNLDYKTLKEHERYCLRLSFARALKGKGKERGTMLKKL